MERVDEAPSYSPPGPPPQFQGLRAAAYGHPFQPCAGLHGSDLPRLNGWVEIPDPYGSGKTTFLIPPIQPDFAVIHANEVDEEGNVRVYGTSHWDCIMSRAARRILVTAERVVPKASFQERPELTLIPSFMVEAAAVVPRGAWPGSLHPDYGVDYDAVQRYLTDTPDAMAAHLNEAPETEAPEAMVTFSGVNSTPAMLACLMAQRAYDFEFTYLNVAGGVDPGPLQAPISSSDPELAKGSAAIFANEDFYDLCGRGGMDLCYLGAAQVDGIGRTNVSCIGDWHNPKIRLPGGGGGAVMLPTAKRAVTWRTEHSRRTLVEKLDFVTAAGSMHGVVTPPSGAGRCDPQGAAPIPIA